MPYKDKAKQRASVNDWYRRHRVERQIQMHKRADDIAKWFYDLKSTLKCSVCPENHHSCLQFHHREPSQKEFTIADASKSGISRGRLLAEIAKCDVLCANCHFKEHWREKQIMRAHSSIG